MKNFLNQHKEIVFLIGIVFVATFASYDLFSEQQQNSGLIHSGITLSPSNFSGRASCEVPLTGVDSTAASDEANAVQKNLQMKHSQNKPALRNN